MACDQCDALRTELAYLRGERANASRFDLVRSAYPEMSPSEVRMVLMMFDASGAAVDNYDLTNAASKNPDDLAEPDMLVKVHVHRIRSSLTYAAVETVRQVGYRLSASGMARVSQALLEAA